MSIEHAPVRGRRLLRTAEVTARVGCSRTTLWRWIQAGRFPKPTHPGPGMAAWPEDEVDAFFDRLIEERDTEVAGAS